MVKANDPSLNEGEFLLEALKQQIRIDGRGIYDVRSIEIKFGAEYGQVEVQLGRTRYIYIYIYNRYINKYYTDVLYTYLFI